MSENKNNISPELWTPLEQEEKNAEKMERPSLTFLQDGWRRLKANKIAIFSLVVIIIITLGAIFIPFFWKYDYKTQNLELANIPVIMKVYPLENGKNIYVTPQYSVVIVDEKGNLEGLAKSTKKDVAAKKNYFDVAGSEVCVDYSVYSEAGKEFKKLEKKAAKKGTDMVNIQGISYLEKYYKGTDIKEVSVEEAKGILENKIQRTQVSCDGNPLKDQTKLRNRTYLLGTDGLGRDLFIRIVYGARISLLVGIFAAFINFVVGVFYGAIAGYCGGMVDNIMMRIIDVLDSIPMTLYVILIMVVVGPGITSIILGVMYLGSLVEFAETEELYEHTLHPYTKALMSAVPELDPAISKKKHPEMLKGDVPSPIDTPKGCKFASRCPHATNRCKEERPIFKDVGGNHFVACHLVG